MQETDTIDVGGYEYDIDGIQAMDLLSVGDYQLGDGIDLSVESSDRQGHVKFEFVKVYGRTRAPFVIREDAWRCLVQHKREIDVWLLRCEHKMLELSEDTTLATYCTAYGERYVRLQVRAKSGRATTFEITHTAWTYLANEAKQISRDADSLRRY